MFVIKKIGKHSFICERWYQFRCKYEWSDQNDVSSNISIYNKIEDAQEICDNLNEDENGEKRDLCEVVELNLGDFRLC